MSFSSDPLMTSWGGMEQILNTGKENPAYLQRFVREHEKALAALNTVSALAPVAAPVLAAGNSVIEPGEYVFRVAAGLPEFARELHRPISEVLEYPTTEFNSWSVVFQDEYYEAYPHERYQSGMTECDCAGEIEKFKRMMRRR